MPDHIAIYHVMHGENGNKMLLLLYNYAIYKYNSPVLLHVCMLFKLTNGFENRYYITQAPTLPAICMYEHAPYL